MDTKAISYGKYRGKPFTPAANDLAFRIAKIVAGAKGTHEDKFVALVAVIQALGVTTDMYMDDPGPRTNAPGQDVCELKLQ